MKRILSTIAVALVLTWGQALAQAPAQGAPVALDAAHKRALNTFFSNFSETM